MSRPWPDVEQAAALSAALRPFVALWVAAQYDPDDQTIDGNGYLGDGPGGLDTLCVGHLRSLIGAAIGAGLLYDDQAKIDALAETRRHIETSPEMWPVEGRRRFREALDIFLVGRVSDFAESAGEWVGFMSDEAVASDLAHRFDTAQRDIDGDL